MPQGNHVGDPIQIAGRLSVSFFRDPKQHDVPLFSQIVRFAKLHKVLPWMVYGDRTKSLMYLETV